MEKKAKIISDIMVFQRLVAKYPYIKLYKKVLAEKYDVSESYIGKIFKHLV